jgi:hypothetical protein
MRSAAPYRVDWGKGVGKAHVNVLLVALRSKSFLDGDPRSTGRVEVGLVH